MKWFWHILAILLVVLFVAFASMLVYNTWSKEVKESVITINVTAEQQAANGRSIRITQKSAYVARKEAQNEYDKSFSTLLTVLTIFGIAWPLMVAFVQYKFNERELAKIQKTDEKVSQSLDDAKKALSQADKAIVETNQLRTDTRGAYIKSIKRSKTLFGTIELAFVAMARKGDIDYANHCYVLGLLCRFWSIQLSKEIELDLKTMECMINGANRIKPESKATETSKSCKKFLKLIRKDLPSCVNTKDPKILSLVVQLYGLLDEKIAAYEKLLNSVEVEEK